MPSTLTAFDAEVARRVDNTKLPGFGVAQAGMVRRAMFQLFAERFNENPAAALKHFLHMVEIESDRDG